MKWPHALYGHTQGAGHTGRGVQSVGCRAWGAERGAAFTNVLGVLGTQLHTSSQCSHTRTHTRALTRTLTRTHHMHHMHHMHHTHLCTRVKKREEGMHAFLRWPLVWGGSHGLLLMVVFPLCGRCDFFLSRQSPPLQSTVSGPSWGHLHLRLSSCPQGSSL